MRIEIAGPLRGTTAGAIAEEVVGSCVHCGMCNSACPTYRLTGDELDGPRGRIYLMKQALEGHAVSRLSQSHLDRCLECRACETACPSGVEYHRLLDIGRAVVADVVPRALPEKRNRWLVRQAAAHPGILSGLVAVGRAVRPLLPAGLADKLPPRTSGGVWPTTRHPRRMMILGGCVQSAFAHRFNAATARVFDRLGISLVERGGCCGAVPFHLEAAGQSKVIARRQIDAFHAALRSGHEAIIVNASGCAAFMRDWPDLLIDDVEYADKARHILAHLKDPIEVLAGSALAPRRTAAGARVAVHVPCTLRNGPGLGGAVGALLSRLGYDVLPVADEGLCCGSAGTYSLFQPGFADRLRDDKIAALTTDGPVAIFTGNIGCWMHLSATSPVPVRHWIEAVDDVI